METTPQHCPGFEQFKKLKAFSCKCPGCGKEKEIFSDEFDKTHTCSGCGKEIDFTQCSLEAGT
jgi:uncharacterized protein (DUF983 family)